MAVAEGEFAFELFGADNSLISTFYNDANGLVEIKGLLPGSYVLKEIPNLFWDTPFRGTDGDYNLVWLPAVINIVVAADGTVTLSGDINNGIVNNVVACKHNYLWVSLGYHYSSQPCTQKDHKGGTLVDFVWCPGYLVPTYQAARCGVPGFIWFACSEGDSCGITTSIQVQDALEHIMQPSGQFTGDGENEWYVCAHNCGHAEARPVLADVESDDISDEEAE